ncbi:MAG: CoA ester lyase [Nocardioidaceae bacterium]|nr:CoA ester lyase [Nocardioidaceae bacterium]
MSTRRGPVWLFVPGSHPDRFAKAVATGADQVICDLEDAVAPDTKGAAREAVGAWLSQGGEAWVRVNPVGSAWHRDDLRAIAGRAGLRGVIVPKAERARDLHEVHDLAGAPVLALVETAAGVERIPDILGADGVEGVALGTVDLALDLGCDEDSGLIAQVRHRAVLASRAAGSAAPVDGVTRSLTDAARARTDAEQSRRDGFAGKLAVHPAQVEPIRAGFAPTPEQVAWARAVVEADGRSGGAATVVGGGLVDLPVVERARRILGVGEEP